MLVLFSFFFFFFLRPSDPSASTIQKGGKGEALFELNNEKRKKLAQSRGKSGHETTAANALSGHDWECLLQK